MQVPTSTGSVVDPTNMVLLIDRGSNPTFNHNAQPSIEANKMTSSMFHQNPLLPTAFNQSPMILNSQNVYGKDSRWLTLEVCREFQRGKCTRSEEECKFAHPADHVEVTNGKVIACFDNLKGRCQRIDPPCKYLHPPQHLKEILQHNGRNNLILRSIALQGGLQSAPIATPLYRGQFLGSNGTTFLATGIPAQVAIAANPTSVGGQAILQTLSPQSPLTMPYAYAASPNALSTMITAQGQHAFSSTAPAFFALNAAYNSPTAFPLNFTQSMPSQLIDPSNISPTFLCNSNYGNTGSYSPEGSDNVQHLQQIENRNQFAPLRTDRLEVCVNFQKGICTNNAASCQYAHPPSHCPIDAEGLVTVCVDFVKGKCKRESCKYFHPPNHLLYQLKSHSTNSSNNINLLNGTIQNLSYPPSQSTGTILYNSLNPQNTAILANNRYITGMMLANQPIATVNPSTATAAYQNVTSIQTHQGFIPPGSIILAPATSPASQTGVTAFFPNTTQFLANRHPSSYQATPTIFASPQQLLGTLTYLPSKRHTAFNDVVASVTKKRKFDDSNYIIRSSQMNVDKSTYSEESITESVAKEEILTDAEDITHKDQNDISNNQIIRTTPAVQIGN